MVSRTCDSVASSYARMRDELISARSRLVVMPLTWSRLTMSNAAKSCSWSSCGVRGVALRGQWRS